MRKKKVKRPLTGEEINLLEVLKRISYKSRKSPETIQEFIVEHENLIKRIEPEPESKYPNQWTILFAHYKTIFANEENIVTFNLPKKIKDSDELFIKKIKRTCSKISRAFKTEKFKVMKCWGEKDFLLVILFIIKKGSRVGNYGLIRPYNRGIKYLASLYLDKKKNELSVHNISDQVLNFFNLILQEETGVNFVQPKKLEEISWTTVCENFYDLKNKLELVEMGLNKTDFSTGNPIVIKPKDRDLKEYLYALLDQKKILDKDKFNLAYIEYIKIRRKNKKYNTIKFSRTEEDAIVLTNVSPHKDSDLIKRLEEFGLPLNIKLIDPEKIPKSRIIQHLLISKCVQKEEAKTNSYREAIKYLKEKGIIRRIGKRNIYLCIRNPTCRSGSFFLYKKCPICNKKDKTIRIPNGLRLYTTLENVKTDLKKIFGKQKIKYRRLRAKPFYDNKFELQKVSFSNLPEINIYFNDKGLYQPVLKNFRICPLPLMVINFRGELKDDLNYIHQKDASDFIEMLYNNGKLNIIQLIKKVAEDSRYGEKKETAFYSSMQELRNYKKKNTLINSRKGNMYEWLAFNLLSYLFPVSDKWGGKSLPDGIIGITCNDGKKFIFWDAKRYDDTKLTRYARKKKGGIAKDIKYILKSISKEDTYEEGELQYYLFITSNTHKEDFMEVKEIIKKKIQKVKDRTKLFKRLSNIKFCCLNLDELIKLGSIFEEKKNFEIIKRKFNLFEEAFEKLLNLDEGYITQDNIDKTITPLLIENLFIPDKKEHRID